MRIALVGPAHPYKGGIVHHTTQLAHRLTAAGHHVQVESWYEQYPQRLYPGQQRVDEPEVRLFEPTRTTLSWRRPDTWWRLGRRLRGEVDAVVIIVVSPVQVPAQLVVLAALGRRMPTVALCHNVLPHEPSPVDRPLVRALLRRVGGVLVHSERERHEARRLTSVPVVEVPLAPHLPGGRPAGALPQAEDAARHRLLFFGLVRPYKGLDVLLDALARSSTGAALIVAGEFWGGDAGYRDQAASLGLDGRVQWRPGYLPAAELPELLASVDALVLPYRSATASQNVGLAHAHGLPVLATRTGALADAVEDGVDGLVVEPGDADALARAIDELYRPGRLAALRRAVAQGHADDEGRSAAGAWARYVDALQQLLSAEPLPRR